MENEGWVWFLVKDSQTKSTEYQLNLTKKNSNNFNKKKVKERIGIE